MKLIKKDISKITELFSDLSNKTSHEKDMPICQQTTPWYADIDSNYIGYILSRSITQKYLQKIADKYYGPQVDKILTFATEITNCTYPAVHAIYLHCCKELGFNEYPKIYITSSLHGINAISVETRGKKLIFISRRVALLPPEEQAFILGHELSHHQQGNLICHTINGLLTNMHVINEIFGNVLPDSIEIPLKKWYRCSEINADRAGYLCSRNIASIEKLFKRVGLYEEPTSLEIYKELKYTHPLNVKRFQELQNYIKKIENGF